MWKLWNYLFGWQYVFIHFKAYSTERHEIRRISQLPNGEWHGYCYVSNFYISVDKKMRLQETLIDWKRLTT